jgi:glycosyltransferase involved in cell wall biosynthesis
MKPESVYIDLSELSAHPLRTGIQRVEREAIRYWPGPASLVPCCVGADGQLLRLSEDVLDVLCRPDDGSSAGREEERRLLRDMIAAGTALNLNPDERLINLELFFGAERAEAHIRCVASGVRVLWYIYDFLPFLRPELFPPRTAHRCMHFLRGVRAVARGAGGFAFLSAQSRAEYAARVARKPERLDWPVISPGADGLGLEPQSFSVERRDFLSFGTVESRKNQISMLHAFEALWAAGRDARLVVAGRLSPDAKEELAFFAQHRENPRLVVLEQPADDTLRQLLRGARAVIMPSEAEGFGLPPYEALQAGIPSIASALIPSAAMMPQGAILLERMTPAAIGSAVETLCDDQAAGALWAAAANVRLPTWAEFGRSLGQWVQEG